MLRFISLLSFILCIELAFSYNYIDETAEHDLNKFGRNVRRERDRKIRRPKERRSLIRQEYDYDRGPVEFDVASFIQPEDESREDEEASRYRKRRLRTSKTYDSLDTVIGMNVDEGNKKRERSLDYLNVGDSSLDLNINPPLLKDEISPKHMNYNPSLDDLHSQKYEKEKFRNVYKDDLLMDQNGVHSHSKKCTLKNIKFPFFSHNKSETLKPKKNRKRKLFCFNCPKKDENRLKLMNENKNNDDPVTQYKIKRSYEQRLCPACKKLFVVNSKLNERRKKTPKRIIHNSRQFYQTNFPEANLKEDVKNLRKNNMVYSEVSNAYYREKREDNIRERQLKELEDIQRKVDDVEVNMPRFEKPSNTKESIVV